MMKKHGKFKVIVLVLLIVLFISALAFGILFRLADIVIQGDSIDFSANDIFEATSLKKGNLMLFIDLDDVKNKLLHEYPSYNVISIYKEYPSKLVIVAEKSLVRASVEMESGKRCIIDEYFHILSSDNLNDNIIIVSGLTAFNGTAGELLSYREEDTIRVEYLSALLREFKKNGLYQSVSVVDLDNISNIILLIGDTIWVKLGNIEKLAYKLSRANSVIIDLSANELQFGGTIDVRDDEKTYFSPGTQ